MTKITAILLGVTAAGVALVLLLLGWRRLHVDEGAAHTMRGRFLVAVAFFLAVFGGAVDRAFSADRPPAVAKQQLSLADMQKAVEAIFQRGPAGNDWRDPGINPNIYQVLAKTGVIRHPLLVECYMRAALPVKARSTELAALQRRILNEKIKAGVIPEEVGAKITAIPPATAATRKEIRTYQLKVRRVARLLYKAGELDSATIQQLEAAIRLPIAKLDPVKALKADVTYLLQSRTPWNWPADVRKEYLAALARQGLINKVRTRRGEMRTFRDPHPNAVAAARTRVEHLVQRLAGADDVTLPGDKGARPIVLTQAAAAKPKQYQLNVRRAVRILIAEKVLTNYDAQAAAKLIGMPLFGTVMLIKIPVRPQIMCYEVMVPPTRLPQLPRRELRELRDQFGRTGAVPDDVRTKLDAADERRTG